MLNSTRIRKENIYLLCSQKWAWYDKWNFSECFNFAEKCSLSIKAALGLNGNSAKVREEKFQFCRPAILSGHQGRRRPKVLVWPSRGSLSPALCLLSPAWPGAPHVLPMSHQPPCPIGISSYPHIAPALGQGAWKFAHVKIWQSAWRRKKLKCQSTI